MLREKLANDISKIAMEKTAITVDAAFRALRNISAKGERVQGIPMSRWHRVINRMKDKSPENAARINQIADGFPNVSGTYSDEFFPKVREFLKGNVRSADQIERGDLSQTYTDRHIRRLISPTAEASAALKSGNGSLDKELRKEIARLTPAENAIAEQLKKDVLKPNWVAGSPSVEHLTAQHSALRKKTTDHIRNLTSAGNDFTSGIRGIADRLEYVPDVARGLGWASYIKRRLGFSPTQKALTAP